MRPLSLSARRKITSPLTPNNPFDLWSHATNRDAGEALGDSVEATRAIAVVATLGDSVEARADVVLVAIGDRVQARVTAVVAVLTLKVVVAVLTL